MPFNKEPALFTKSFACHASENMWLQGIFFRDKKNFFEKNAVKEIVVSFVLIMSMSCNDQVSTEHPKQPLPVTTTVESEGAKYFEGIISNGMKGDKISFEISSDGTKLQNLVFTGYWRCAGKLEQTTAGPEGSFTVVNNKVSGHISEPPNGGSTAWRFDLEAVIEGKKASGTFRMNINNLGCDTYKLSWAAVAR